MKLLIYLKKNKMSMRELAIRVGVTPATMSKIVNQEMSPSLKTATKILFITGDELDFLDLCSERDMKELEQFYIEEETLNNNLKNVDGKTVDV